MDVVCLCPLRAASLLWQSAPERWARTVIVKATYRIQPGTSPLAEEQEHIHESESHWDDDPKRSLYTPSDLVPLKPRADVVLVGNAYAPNATPVRSVVVRIRVRDIDKAVEVYCSRLRTRAGDIREGNRWTKMPLLYERAAGGPDTANPVGIAPDAAADTYGQRQIPNLQPPGFHITPDNLEIPTIGLGPIAAGWQQRSARLGRGYRDRDWARAPFAEGFDPAYFQAAPADQQIDKLRPDERMVLEHLHPEHARLVTHLPNIEPQVLFEPRTGASKEVVMSPDTLWIDTSRSICTLTFRGKVEIEHPEARGRFVIAMAKSGYRPNWPKILEGAPPLPPEPRAPSPSSLDLRPPPESRPAEPRAPSYHSIEVQPATPAPSPRPSEVRRVPPVEPRPSEVRAPDSRIIDHDRASGVAPQRPLRAPSQPAMEAVRPPPVEPRPDPEPAGESAASRPRRPQTLQMVNGGPPPERSPLPFQRAQPGKPVPASIPSAAPTPAPIRADRRQTLELDAPNAAALPSWLARESAFQSLEEIDAEPTDDIFLKTPALAQPSVVMPPAAVTPPAPAVTVPPAIAMAQPPVVVAPPAVVSPPALADLLRKKDGAPFPEPTPLHPAAVEKPPLFAPISASAPPLSVTPALPLSPPVPLSVPITISPPATMSSPRASDPIASPSVLAASNAAAAAAERAPGEGASYESRQRSVAPVSAIELLWFDPALVPLLRKHPSFSAFQRPAPEPVPAGKQPPRLSHDEVARLMVFDVLSRGTPRSGRDLESLDAGDEEGLSAPLVLTKGEIELPFDEIEVLRAVCAVSRSLAHADKKLKESLDMADEVLKAPMRGMSDMASGLTLRVRDAWSRANRSLPATYLDSTTERMLLEQRSYQKRELLDDTWIRALLSGDGYEPLAPTYLPVKIEKRIPLFKRFAVRLLAHVHPAQDQYETSPLCLRALAVARVVPARGARPSREPR